MGLNLLAYCKLCRGRGGRFINQLYIACPDCCGSGLESVKEEEPVDLDLLAFVPPLDPRQEAIAELRESIPRYREMARKTRESGDSKLSLQFVIMARDRQRELDYLKR